MELASSKSALHSNGGSCRFGPRTHQNIVDAFYDISRDPETRVMILTGTGDNWIAEFDESQATQTTTSLCRATGDRVYWEGKKGLQNLLDIDVPVIAAVNGPALVHSEYILTCDAVIASDNAVFQDLPHLTFGLVPGDGVHVLWPTRARFSTRTLFLDDPAEARRGRSPSARCGQ